MARTSALPAALPSRCPPRSGAAGATGEPAAGRHAARPGPAGARWAEIHGRRAANASSSCRERAASFCWEAWDWSGIKLKLSS